MWGTGLKYLFTLAVIAAAVPAAGQEIALFRERLSRPAMGGSATVQTMEHGSAAEAVRRYDHSAKPEKTAGYRIRIFFDNGQNARSQALETQARFRNEFPGIPTFLVYENPSYIVTVGNSASIDEALMLWNRVRKSFSTAFLWRGEIPISGLVRREETPDLTQETAVTLSGDGEE